LSALTLKLTSLKWVQKELLDLKCVRKCKLDGIVCPQVQFLQAQILYHQQDQNVSYGSTCGFSLAKAKCVRIFLEAFSIQKG